MEEKKGLELHVGPKKNKEKGKKRRREQKGEGSSRLCGIWKEGKSQEKEGKRSKTDRGFHGKKGKRKRKNEVIRVGVQN